MNEVIYDPIEKLDLSSKTLNPKELNSCKLIEKNFKEFKHKETNDSFYYSKGSIQRFQIIQKFYKINVPILLEGPTGTSKTKTIQQYYKILDKKLKKINFSSESSIEDLLGRVVSNETKWGSFSFEEGPYLKAFHLGEGILLDELNLCPDNILQCIEDSLDNDEIFLNIPGAPTTSFKKHKEFRIFATQNPDKDGFSGIRSKLSKKVLSRFIPFEFPELSRDEISDIALKHFKNNNKN